MMFEQKASGLVLLGFSALLLSAAPSLGQSRDETLKLISDTMAKANEPFAQKPVIYGEPYPTGYVTSTLERALKTVSELKDQLADNPYFRITAITVSLPWGVSVELTPIEAEEEKP